MKKGILFLGVLVSLSWNAMGDITPNDVAEGLVFAGIRINENVKGIEKNETSIGVNTAKTEANEKGIESNKTNITTNADKVVINEKEIAKNTAETIKNKEGIAKVETKLDEHQKVSDIAIKQLEEQDERLGEADVRIEANVKNLQKHDDAVYEVIGTTRDANATTVKVVKADTNRDMILALQDGSAKTNLKIDENTDKTLSNEKSIAENTDRTLSNEKNIAENTDKTLSNEKNIAANTDKALSNEKNIAANTDKTLSNEKNIAANTDKTLSNEKNIAVNTKKIEYNSRSISNNSQRIKSLEGKVDGLETEMKKGFAMAAAMSSIDFQVLDVGDAGFGLGVGNYKNSDAVSLGVGVRPTENVTLNVKGAMSTGKGQETMVGGGGVYKFNLFGG